MTALWSVGSAVANTDTTTTVTIPAGATGSDVVILGLIVSDNNSSAKTYTITTSGAGVFTPAIPVTTATNSSAQVWTGAGVTAGDTVTLAPSVVVNGALMLAGHAGIGVGTIGAAGVHAASPDTTTCTAPGFTGTASNSASVGVFTSRLGSGTNTAASVTPGTIDGQFTGGNDGTSIAVTSNTPGSTTAPAATITWGSAIHNGLGVQVEVLQQAAASTGRKVYWAGAWHNVTTHIITGATEGGDSIPLSIPFTIGG